MFTRKGAATAITSVILLLALPLFSSLEATPQPMAQETPVKPFPLQGIFGIFFSYIFNLLKERFNPTPQPEPPEPSNQPPSAPHALTPTPGATNISTNTTFHWTCSDPDNDPLSYTITLQAPGQPATTIYQGTHTQTAHTSLASNTSYTWTITATDSHTSTTTTSTFTTTPTPQPEPPEPSNQPPSAPHALTPTPGATNISTNTTFHWTCSDPDNDPLSYTITLQAPGQPATTIYQGTHTQTAHTSLASNTSYTWTITATDSHTSTTTTSTFTTTPTPQPEPNTDDNHSGWTVMAYLNGDNNLDRYARNEWQEINASVLQENVTVVVMLDGNSSSDSRLYVVTSQGAQEMPLSEIRQDWGNEVNMGDGGTLSAFIDYAMENHPARHYMLELWSHGSGWMGMCNDATAGDRLQLSEITDALAAGIGNRSEKIDVVTYTACKMAEIECASGLAEHVDYFVASQESVFASGLPHTQVLESVHDTTSPSAYATVIVDRFESFYQHAPGATISVWHLNRLDNLTCAVDGFAQSLATGNRNVIQMAYNDTESFGGIGLVDLWHFCSNIQQHLGSDTVLYGAAQRVMENISAIVYDEWNGGSHPDAHGMSIYFPREGCYIASYGNTAFASLTYWDEFLQTYC